MSKLGDSNTVFLGTASWANITSKPTTLSGYGITDGFSSGGGTITGDVTINKDAGILYFNAPSSGSYTRIKFQENGVDKSFITHYNSALSYPLWSNKLVLESDAIVFSSQGEAIGIKGNTINARPELNGYGSMWLNYTGYLWGTTQFRNLYIGDGKNNLIAEFIGSDKSTTLYGDILKCYNGDGISLYQNQIIGNYNANSPASFWINYSGYQAGLTQFRDLYIGDGKGNAVASFRGSDKLTGLYGAVNITGNLTAPNIPYKSSQSLTAINSTGWWRVAVSPSGQDHLNGLFSIFTAMSGYHQQTKFTASGLYGQQMQLNQLSHSYYQLAPISYVRIVYHTTYSGNYAYLEVYSSQNPITNGSISVIDNTGWEFITPTAGSIPSGYTSVQIYFAGSLSTSNGINAPFFKTTSSLSFPGTATTSESYFYNSSSNGTVIYGCGTTYDLDICNKLGSDVITIPTGTTNVNISGTLKLIKSTAPTSISSNYLQVGGAEYLANSYRTIGFGYTTSGSIMPAFIGYQEMDVANYTKGDLIFGTRSVTTNIDPVERMRIKADGRIGIATSSPIGLLHVNNTAYDTCPLFERSDQTSDAGWISARFLATHTTDMGTGFGSGIEFAIRDNVGIVSPIANICALRYGADNTGQFRIQTMLNGTAIDSMFISPNGIATEVRIGGSAKPWADDFDILQVNNTSFMNSAGVTRLFRNAYFNGANEKRIASGYAEAMYQVNGNHLFQYADTGAADSEITWTKSFQTGISGNAFGTTTLKSWHPNYKAIQIGGLGAVMSEYAESASKETILIHNAYVWTSSETWRYKINDEACFIRFHDGNMYYNYGNGGVADSEVTTITTFQTGKSGSTFYQNLGIASTALTLNSSVTGAPSNNAYIIAERGTSTDAQIIWDETADVWKFGLAGSEKAIASTDVATTSVNGLMSATDKTKLDGLGTGSQVIAEVYNIAGTYYFMPPVTGTYNLIIVGAGGAGGNSRTGLINGGGGGGSGYMLRTQVTVTALKMMTITVGSGGTISGSDGGNGNSGGVSSIAVYGGSTYSANGGSGGAGVSSGGIAGIGGNGGMAGGGGGGGEGIGHASNGGNSASYTGGSYSTGYGGGGAGQTANGSNASGTVSGNGGAGTNTTATISDFSGSGSGGTGSNGSPDGRGGAGGGGYGGVGGSATVYRGGQGAGGYGTIQIAPYDSNYHSGSGYGAGGYGGATGTNNGANGANGLVLIYYGVNPGGSYT